MNIIKKILELFDKVLDVVLIGLFSSMTIIILLQIFGRYFFNFTIMWAEEYSRYAFVSIIWLGSARAFILEKHIIVDILVEKMPERLKIYLNVFLYFLIIIMLIYITIEGIIYSRFYWDSYFYSTYSLKLGYAYAVIPIASILMILNTFRIIFKKCSANSLKINGERKQ